MKVLIAEDDVAFCESLEKDIKDWGYDVITANNGKEAIEKYSVDTEKFNLILMDINMPEMDGLEATRVLRNRGYNDIPIIAVTADVMKQS